MNQLWKRSISLLLALIMVLGLVPMNVWTVDANAAAVSDTDEDSLVNAHGLIWLTKAEDGGASQAFLGKITAGELDDMIRAAVGDTTGATVTYDGMDVGNVFALVLQQEKLTALKDDLTEAVSNHKLVTFMVGGVEKKIAFRNILTATVDVVDVYIESKGEPADLADQVADALANPDITIEHIEEISLEMAGAEVSGSVKYDYTWPEAGADPVEAGVIATVTITAADDETVTVSDTGYVYLRDTRGQFTVTYQGEGVETVEYPVIEGDATPTIPAPVRNYYTFKGWDPAVAGTVTGDVTYNATWTPITDNNGNKIADQEEKFTVTYKDGVGGSAFADKVYTLAWGTATPAFTPTREYYNFQGWSPAVADEVTEDVVYTATWTPIMDNNGNKIADQEETFTITFYVDGEVFATLNANGGAVTPTPADPEKAGFNFAGWGDIASKVTGNAEYHAQWTANFVVTYVITLPDRTQATAWIAAKDDGTAINPGLGEVEDSYWTGWYTLGADGKKTTFDFTTVLTGNTTLYCDYFYDKNDNGIEDGTVNDPYIIYQFLNKYYNVVETVKFVGEVNREFSIDNYSPAVYDTDDIVFTGWKVTENEVEENGYKTTTYTCAPAYGVDRNNNEIVDGSAEDPFAYYYFMNADGSGIVDFVEWLAGDDVPSPESYTCPVTGYQVFLGWDDPVETTGGDGYTKTYTYYPNVIDDENGNGKDDSIENDKIESSIDGATGVITGTVTDGVMTNSLAVGNITYTSTVKIVNRNGAGKQYNALNSDGSFIFDETTEIRVEPLWNANKEMAAYVEAVKVNGESLELYYEDFVAIYKPANALVLSDDQSDAANTIEIVYGFAVLELTGSEVLALGGTYTEGDVYQAIASTSTPAYDEEAVTVLYQARQAGSAEIDLSYLYSRLDTNMVKPVKDFIGGDTIEVSYAEMWLPVNNTVETKTAQEVANEFIDSVLEDCTEDGELNLQKLIGKANRLVAELEAEVNKNANVRNFATSSGGDSISEYLRITYQTEKFSITETANVICVEGRKSVTIHVPESVTKQYGTFSNDDLLDLVTVFDEDGNQVIGTVKLDNKYDGMGVGTYNVKVTFAETEEYKSASATFELKIVKMSTSIIVENLTVDQGKAYDPSPVVTPEGAQVIQVLAGVAISELDLDLVEGVVSNNNTGVINVKAWIKLPAAYNEVLTGVGIVDYNDAGEVNFYLVDDIEEKLENTALESAMGDALSFIDEMLDSVESKIKEKLGITTEFELQITFAADEYPTDSGFYLNFAQILDTTNYEEASAYGTLIITPLLATPNDGGVQLVYGGKAENLFVFENEGIARELEVTHNGVSIENEIYYYGVTTRLNPTKSVPSVPGIYVATTILTDTDAETGEVTKVGSDMVLMVIKGDEVNIDVTGDVVVYDGYDHKPTVTITDKDGNKVSGSYTMISGTAGVNTNSTNVGLSDLTANVNIDFPEKLDDLWDEYCAKYVGKGDTIKPATVIAFLEYCIKLINDKIPVDTLSSVGVPEEYIIKFQKYMTAAFNELITQIDKLPEDISISMKDMDELEFINTGVYLFVGVVTDPDMMPNVGTGLVVIKTEDTYVMSDTVKPYDGKVKDIDVDDQTSRDGITIFVDDNGDFTKVNFQLDGDMTAVLTEAMELAGFTLNPGSDVFVGTIYKKGEAKFSDLQEALFNKVRDISVNRLTLKLQDKYPGASAELNQALKTATEELDKALTKLWPKMSAKLQELDHLSNDTLIIVNGKMPVDAGEYEFYGFDYDVAWSSATLTIEPIHIVVEAVSSGKNEGEDDPELEAEVSYYSYNNNGKVEVALPDGVELDDILDYTVTRDEGEEVGTYTMSVNAELLNNSGNYVLDEVVNGEFEIMADVVVGTIVGEGVNLSLDGVFYMNYYVSFNDFSDGLIVSGDKEQTGVLVWTGEEKPEGRNDLVVGSENCMAVPVTYSEDHGFWCAVSGEIYAKNLGDMQYFRAYVKVGDEYVYGPVNFKSPSDHCYSAIERADLSVEEKELCASILEYGAAAQNYYDFDTENLVNAELSAENYNLEFDQETMACPVPTPSAELAQTLTGIYDTEVVSLVGATLSTHEAIYINVGYNIQDVANISEMKLLIWEEDDYNEQASKSDGTLEYYAETYTYSVDLKLGSLYDTECYVASTERFVAHEYDKAIYFCPIVIMNDGTIYRGSFSWYSPQTYIYNQLGETDPKLVDLVKALAVYGYKADLYHTYLSEN